jgi:hypothetical protein
MAQFGEPGGDRCVVLSRCAQGRERRLAVVTTEYDKLHGDRHARPIRNGCVTLRSLVAVVVCVSPSAQQSRPAAVKFAVAAMSRPVLVRSAVGA